MKARTLRQRLRLAREKRDRMTQSELSVRAGLARTYVSLVEREENDPDGIKKPGLAAIKRIADVLDVPVEWLAFNVGPEPDWDRKGAA